MSNELTPAQRRTLKGRAHTLTPVVHIGVDGLTPSVLAEIDRALHAHELIKIRVLGADGGARDHLLRELCAATRRRAGPTYRQGADRLPGGTCGGANRRTDPQGPDAARSAAREAEPGALAARQTPVPLTPKCPRRALGNHSAATTRT